ncbi:hypothetical protein GN958_ATG08086, partial [Phytophthora infestans]
AADVISYKLAKAQVDGGRDISWRDYVRGHHPDHHAGRIVRTGVALILATFPPLQSSDNFVDIGSGIENVVAQCVGIELQNDLGQLSEMQIQAANEIAQAEIQDMSVLYSNNIGFDPTSNAALEKVATAVPTLTHLVGENLVDHAYTVYEWYTLYLLTQVIDKSSSTTSNGPTNANGIAEFSEDIGTTVSVVAVTMSDGLNTAVPLDTTTDSSNTTGTTGDTCHQFTKIVR